MAFSIIDSRTIGERNPSPGKASLLLCVTRKDHPSSSKKSGQPLLQSDYQNILSARQPLEKINKSIFKSLAKNILGKKTYAKLVSLKERFRVSLSLGVNPVHYRPVSEWPPIDFPRPNRVGSKAKTTFDFR